MFFPTFAKKCLQLAVMLSFPLHSVIKIVPQKTYLPAQQDVVIQHAEPVAAMDFDEILDKIKVCCPEPIQDIFAPDVEKWRNLFAKNCKEWLKDSSFAGEFGLLYPQDVQSSQEQPNPRLEYAFFKGSKYADKLILIAPGGFYDKHFALPYLILLNKVLGFSCAMLDYRGHENSWDLQETAIKNPLLRNCNIKRACGIDSSQCSFGQLEGLDFYLLAKQICKREAYIKEVYGLGLCFGAIVLARAQNLALTQDGKNLFSGLLLISPLPSTDELITNLLTDSRALSKFISKKIIAILSHKKGFRLSRFFSKLPLINHIVSWAIKRYLAIKPFDGMQEFKKLQVPLLILASKDSDYIVKERMVHKVWSAIPAKQKLLLWSFGIEHLLNWHEETGQLTNIFKQFFSNPVEVITKPVALLG